MHLAHDLQATFADGIFFVSLASISDPTLIIPTMAQTLGVPESPSRSLWDSLKGHLHDRQTLIVLDNFEQIIAAAPLLTELLSVCPRMKMLVTSREALRVRGEQEFSVSPLALPGQPATIESPMQYPAIALFVQRAQSIQPDFQLTSENTATVAEICARLDGLPLAIELAAARIKLLPPQSMRVRLQESALGLLTAGARDLPARQQTLRATIQWSYDSLTAAEQRVFRWLAVFVAGCTLDAATSKWSPEIGSVACQTPISKLDMVSSLVNKNLLRQTETDDQPRLSMLETIREFGLAQVSAQPQEWEAARRAHAAYYLSLAEAAEPNLTGAEQKTWLQRLDREQDNLRTALRWAQERSVAEFAQRMTGALWRFWIMRGYWSEGRRWLEESLSNDTRDSIDQAVLAKALHGTSMLARYQGDFGRARALSEQSVALCRTLGDKVALLSGLMQTARIIGFQAERTGLEALVAEALALAPEVPDSPVKAQAYADVVVLLPFLSDRQYRSEAAGYLADSERIQRTFSNWAGLAATLNMQASLATEAGNYPRAEACYAEAESLAAEIGDYRLLLRIPAGWARLEGRRGDNAAARRHLEAYLHLGRNLDDVFMPYALQILAATLWWQGHLTWAARVFGLGASWRGGNRVGQGHILNAEEYQSLNEARDQVRAQLGETAFALAYAEGAMLTLDDVLAIPYPPDLGSAAPAQVASATPPMEPLTGREMEALRLLAQDLSNPQIAGRLVISRRTVDAHLRAIYEKLGVKSRDAAIRVARERRLI
jgi:predicted ATPase/DNA-binding CsgD family transcriptional regulator